MLPRSTLPRYATRTRAAVKDIKIGKIPTSRCCSSETHDLSAAWAKRRPWRIFYRVFVAHGRERSSSRNVARRQSGDSVNASVGCPRPGAPMGAARSCRGQFQGVRRTPLSRSAIGRRPSLDPQVESPGPGRHRLSDSKRSINAVSAVSISLALSVAAAAAPLPRSSYSRTESHTAHARYDSLIR
jgi:hypothetical protein